MVMVILMMTCVGVDLEFGVGRMGFQGIGDATKLPWKHPMNSASRFVHHNFITLSNDPIHTNSPLSKSVALTVATLPPT